MKIAVMVVQFPSRSETFVLSQIAGVVSRGHHVDVYANGTGKSSPGVPCVWSNGFHGNVFYFDQGEFGIPINKFNRLAKALYLFSKGKCREKLIFSRSLNIFRHKMKAATLTLFYYCSAFLRNGPYDIVHCHFGPMGEVAATLKNLGAIKGKLITTFHGYDITTYVKQHGPKVYQTLFATGDLFLPISEKWKAELIRLGCPKEKIVVHKMGVDLARFEFHPRKPMARGKLRILTIGRFVEKKGLEYGIRAVAKVLKNYPDIDYQIVGDGILRDELSQLIKQLNLVGHVQLLGWKAHAEVAKLMANADIFLAPSVTANDGDQEGIPVVLMEALAQGLPVVSTLHSGIPELVQDGQSGFLVPERDAEAIAQKLRYLCQYPEKSVEMGKIGRDWVERYHDINKLNDQLVNLYERNSV